MGENSLISNWRRYDALSDAEVVARILSGDRPLFELIMRRYNQRLFRCSRSILNDDGLAQDAMQEAYLNAFRHLGQFRGPDGFGAWLTRITTRAALRISRKESAMKLVGSPPDPDELETDRRQNPESVTINNELIGQVERAIDRLPRDFRVVFTLRELEGLSIQETAGILELNPATVKTRLHRAKSLLQQRYGLRAEEFRTQLYAFAGRRCDAMVAQTFIRLESTQLY